MKRWWMLLVALALPQFAQATTTSSIWDTFLGIGNLSFIGISDGTLVVGFTRILIWFFVFTVLFGTMRFLASNKLGNTPSAPFKYFTSGQAGVIAGCMATITAVFLPAEVLLATGTGWATAVALILIGGPVVGLLYLCWTYPQVNEWHHILTKIILCLLIIWILTAMKYHITKLGGV